MAMPPFDLTLIQALLSSKTVTGDLNELTTSGFYYVQHPTNSPTTAWVHAIVNSSDDNNHVIQLVLPDNGSEGVYYRDQTSGSWASWSKLVTMDQVTAEVTRLLTTVEF